MYLTYDMDSAFLYCTVHVAAHKNKINPFRQLTPQLRIERFGKKFIGGRHFRQLGSIVSNSFTSYRNYRRF